MATGNAPITLHRQPPIIGSQPKTVGRNRRLWAGSEGFSQWDKQMASEKPWARLETHLPRVCGPCVAGVPDHPPIFGKAAPATQVLSGTQSTPVKVLQRILHPLVADVPMHQPEAERHGDTNQKKRSGQSTLNVNAGSLTRFRFGGAGCYNR